MNIEELKKKSLYKMTNEELLVLINVLINEKVVVMFENDKLKGQIKKAKEYIEEFLEIDEETGTFSLPYTFDGNNLMKLYEMLKEEDYAPTARPEI